MSSNSFLSSVSFIDPARVAAIEWEGSADVYDQQLAGLVTGPHQLILNPQLADQHLHHFIDYVPQVSGRPCVVWLDDQDRWVAKLFPPGWLEGYHAVTITRPQMIWRRNPDLDRSIVYQGAQIYGVYQPAAWDCQYQLVWYLDPRVAPGPDRIWAFSCQSMGRAQQGVKDMGVVMPDLVVQRNPHAPAITVDLEACYPAYWDMDCECAWQLDPVHGPEDSNDPMWLVKFIPSYRRPRDWLWLGVITPQFEIELNPDLPQMSYDLDEHLQIPWHDLAYEHTWLLDPRCGAEGDPDIWAVKARATVDLIAGVKYMGTVMPTLFGQLDVVFISYGEAQAETHWLRVLDRAPHAQRLDGVEGIYAAHRAAAALATTDLFWVVDADAWLLDDWQFDYQPNIWLRHCAHIWLSRNSLNDLEYGYGAVKLLPRQRLLDAWLWAGLDMTTEVFKDLVVIQQVSNETRFNTDAVSTWRSAYRECVKLSVRLRQNPSDWATEELLKAWQTRDYGRPYAAEAIKAARAAARWVDEIYDRGGGGGGGGGGDFDQLLKINDRSWLMDQYRQQMLLPEGLEDLD